MRVPPYTLFWKLSSRIHSEKNGQSGNGLISGKQDGLDNY